MPGSEKGGQQKYQKNWFLFLKKLEIRQGGNPAVFRFP
jgi:hypothetical protein